MQAKRAELSCRVANGGNYLCIFLERADNAWNKVLAWIHEKGENFHITAWDM